MRWLVVNFYSKRRRIRKENCDYKKTTSSSTADFWLISYSFLRVLMLFSVSVVCVHVSWVPCWIFNHRHHLAPASHLASPWRASPRFSWFLVIARWLERQWPVDASSLHQTGSSPSSIRYARIFRSAIRGCDLWNEFRHFCDACPWRWVSAYPVQDILWVPTFALEAAAWLCRYFSMSLLERICGQLTRYSDKLVEVSKGLSSESLRFTKSKHGKIYESASSWSPLRSEFAQASKFMLATKSSRDASEFMASGDEMNLSLQTRDSKHFEIESPRAARSQGVIVTSPLTPS